jgi:hypothetical protein
MIFGVKVSQLQLLQQISNCQSRKTGPYLSTVFVQHAFIPDIERYNIIDII